MTHEKDGAAGIEDPAAPSFDVAADDGHDTREPTGDAAGTWDAVLFASYGTSREEARAASIAPVARTLRGGLGCDGAAPDAPIFMEAYTSAKARRVLARRGVQVPDVSEALHALARSGARRVLVQPGHLVFGAAFAQVTRAVEECRFLFASLVLAEPLLSSDADLAVVAGTLDACHPRRTGEALVLVAHGVEKGGACAGSVYASLGLHLRELGRDDAFVGSMHGYPDASAVVRLLELDRARLGITRVRLVPLMLTAAAHASRDIAGARPGSWRTALEAAGFEVVPELEGLGSLPEVRELYLAHAREAWASAPQAEAAAADGLPEHARFPLFCDLHGARCLVVGLGSVGLRRARTLVAFGADVTAIDPSPRDGAAEEATRLGVVLRRREWQPADLEGMRLVAAATSEPAVNDIIARACGRAGIPVSVASSARLSTFFFPAICASERLVAGVASGGAEHELVARAAACVREVLREVDHG